MDLNFRLPRFLSRAALAVPFLGDAWNVLGEYAGNRRAGLSKGAAVRRAVSVGGAGFAASALPPADVPTYAPAVLRAGAATQRGTEVGKSYELMRSLGIAVPPNPRVLEATAALVDKLNPEAWARRAVDVLDPEVGKTSFSLNPEERLEQLKQKLLSDKITEVLSTGK